MASRTPAPPADEESLAEQTLDSRVAFEGVFLELMVDHVRAADGHEATREYLRHPGAVMVIPLLDNDEVVLERQFRYPLRRTFIEFPAGKIDPGEDALACAKRELLEETGYTAGEWTRIGVIHTSIAYTDEAINIFVAKKLANSEMR